MLLLASHIIAGISLTVASIYDLKTSEVPDHVTLTAIISGLFLHGLASYQVGIDFSQLAQFSILFSDPIFYFQSLGDPLMFSIAVGTVFTLYGWILYFAGMWGGADAMAMSALGFAAPTAVNSFTLGYSVNLFLNILFAGFIYSIAFSVFIGWREKVFSKYRKKIREDRKNLVLQIIAAGFISGVFVFLPAASPFIYFGFLVLMIFLYPYLQLVQESMSKKVPADQVEEGEIVALESGGGRRIKGITQEEIENLDEDVEVVEGVRFIPVFLLGLLITDLFGAGFELIQLIISL